MILVRVFPSLSDLQMIGNIQDPAQGISFLRNSEQSQHNRIATPLPSVNPSAPRFPIPWAPFRVADTHLAIVGDHMQIELVRNFFDVSGITGALAEKIQFCLLPIARSP